MVSRRVWCIRIGVRAESDWCSSGYQPGAPGRELEGDAQTPVYDVYVGILKHRFGTATERHGSGTEHEFRNAVQRWGDTGEPWILFYFCQDSIDPSQLDMEQYGKVASFRKGLEEKRNGLYATYNRVRGSSDSFYEKVSDHLRKVLRRLVVQRLPSSRGLKPSAAASQESRDKIKILFLAALPDDQTRLRLDREYREIETRIRSSKERDRLELVSGWTVRARDLQEILLRERPQIIHFSGHGSSSEELIFEDDAGKSHRVSKQALTRLFGILKDGI